MMSLCVPGSYIRRHSCCGYAVTPPPTKIPLHVLVVRSSPSPHHQPFILLLYRERSLIHTHPTSERRSTGNEESPRGLAQSGWPTICCLTQPARGYIAWRERVKNNKFPTYYQTLHSVQHQTQSSPDIQITSLYRCTPDHSRPTVSHDRGCIISRNCY